MLLLETRKAPVLLSLLQLTHYAKAQVTWLDGSDPAQRLDRNNGTATY